MQVFPDGQHVGLTRSVGHATGSLAGQDAEALLESARGQPPWYCDRAARCWIPVCARVRADATSHENEMQAMNKGKDTMVMRIVGRR